ncbi:MAG: transglycosylase SLT domain-containing protein [Wenzhouxiangellaceae bacterium]
MNWSQGLARIVCAGLLLAASSVSVFADSAARAQFEQAWQAAARGDRVSVEQAIESLGDYPLVPYLKFELLRQKPDAIAPDEMAAFLERHRDWSFADALEQRWLLTLARNGEQAALLEYGEAARQAEAICMRERARLESDWIEGLTERVRELWLRPESQPRACDPLFNWWRRRGNPDFDTAWQRFGLAVEAGEHSLARYLRRYLEPGDRQLGDLWLQMASRPGSGLRAATSLPNQERARRLIAWGLHRLASQDWKAAEQMFQRMRPRFSFEEAEIAPALRRIALFRAVDLDAGAIAAIDALPESMVDQQMLDWRTRTALANDAWDEVLESIRRMSAEQQLRGKWRYWRARALEALQRPEAGLVYATLAAESDYYGFLAALRTGQPLILCNREISADGEIQRRLMADPVFERALELHQVGLNWHARWTFNRSMRSLGRSELEQAALLTAGQGWHDRAIAALSAARATQAYPWRFPVIERERIVREAGQHGVEPALVKGLMRAESAMQPDALSPAGARGLLQLMPATAQAVARRHGIRYQGATDLFHADRNIALGVAHLGELSERFAGDWTLIAAAYNAGIRVAERWQNDRPDMARDIWIETLSFHETRDYIPRVLAFATVYEWLLDQPARVLAEALLDPAPAPGSFACPTL